MTIPDDGDIVRGLGFVTIYAAWVEEAVDELLRILEPIEIFDAKKQRWNISNKLKHTAKLVRTLESDELNGIAEDLEGAVALFDQLNEFIHGRIYAGHDSTDYIQSERAVPTKAITSAELYLLANEFWTYRNHFNGLRLFSLSQTVKSYLSIINQ